MAWFKVYSLIGFDMLCIYLWNNLYNKDSELIITQTRFFMPFCSMALHPLLQPLPETFSSH